MAMTKNRVKEREGKYGNECVERIENVDVLLMITVVM